MSAAHEQMRADLDRFRELVKEYSKAEGYLDRMAVSDEMFGLAAPALADAFEASINGRSSEKIVEALSSWREAL